MVYTLYTHSIILLPAWWCIGVSTIHTPCSHTPVCLLLLHAHLIFKQWPTGGVNKCVFPGNSHTVGRVRGKQNPFHDYTNPEMASLASRDLVIVGVNEPALYGCLLIQHSANWIILRRLYRQDGDHWTTSKNSTTSGNT